MGELISRDWILKRMVFAPDADTVRMAPAVDAEPVRHEQGGMTHEATLRKKLPRAISRVPHHL